MVGGWGRGQWKKARAGGSGRRLGQGAVERGLGRGQWKEAWARGSGRSRGRSCCPKQQVAWVAIPVTAGY